MTWCSHQTALRRGLPDSVNYNLRITEDFGGGLAPNPSQLRPGRGGGTTR